MTAKKSPLRTRLEPRRLSLLADEPERLENFRKWAEEDYEKLLLLRDEIGVPAGPQQFYLLALELARKHIIGFQQRSPQGKWNGVTRGYLVVEIERLTVDRRTQPGHTVAWAADVLSRREEWAFFLGGKGEDRGEALRVQYQQYKREPAANAFRYAFKFRQHEGKISEWEIDLRHVLRSPHS